MGTSANRALVRLLAVSVACDRVLSSLARKHVLAMHLVQQLYLSPLIATNAYLPNCLSVRSKVSHTRVVARTPRARSTTALASSHRPPTDLFWPIANGPTTRSIRTIHGSPFTTGSGTHVFGLDAKTLTIGRPPPTA